jgi:SAM-dependent methyltransferase
MGDRTLPLYCPDRIESITEEQLWRWFQNVQQELALLSLSDSERASVIAYYCDAGLMRPWRRPFFRHHYVTPLLRAVRELFAVTPRPRILDLGCGTGTQSLIFALLGAEVVGVDLDDVALAVFRKRIALYEQHCQRSLPIHIHSGDVFRIDFDTLGPFDAMYSLFAFNMMQPTSGLLERLAPHFSSRAVIAIQDGNREHLFNRYFRKRKLVASREQLHAGLRRIGFSDVSHFGAYAIPPPVWAVVPRPALAVVDRMLSRVDPLAVSFLHVARRGS